MNYLRGFIPWIVFAAMPSNDGDTVDSTTSNLRSTSRYLEFAWSVDFAMVQEVSLRCRHRWLMGGGQRATRR